jgi:hypothetical protein
MLELAGRGHQVTEVTPFLERKIVPNYTQIEVKSDIAAATGGSGKRTRAGNCKVDFSEIYFLSIACDVDFVLGYSVKVVKIEIFFTKYV